MRKTYSLSICVCSLGVFLYSSSALSFPHRTNLVNQIKPNLIAKSKPAHSFTKLAGIYFVSKDDKHKFDSNGTDIKNDPKSCPSGTTWYGGHCEKNCDTKAFPYTDEPDKTKGKVLYEVCQGSVHFGYTSCSDGWLLNSGKCDINPCTGYNLTSAPDSSKGTVAKCKSGENMKYKYTACNSGWNLSNGNCVAGTCSSSTYPYTSHPGSEAGTVIQCKSGTTTKYGYSGCNAGWDKVNGYCNIHTCDVNTYPYTSNPGSAAGTVTQCQTGKTTKYGYTACNNGWTLSGGKCVENTCNGYPYTSSSITGCTTTASCQKGSQKVYKCTAVQNGYTLNDDGTCKENACEGYPSATNNIANCVIHGYCQKGTSKVYNCEKCARGWDVSDGICQVHICTESPYPCVSGTRIGDLEFCYSGDVCTYGYSSCYDRYGFELVDGRCKRPVIYSGKTAIGIGIAPHVATALTDETGEMTWDEAVAACKAKKTGGKIWRLPNYQEFSTAWNESSINSDSIGIEDYAFDKILEANGGKIVNGFYQSADESSSTSNWIISMHYSQNSAYSASTTKKTYKYKVRCVFDF